MDLNWSHGWNEVKTNTSKILVATDSRDFRSKAETSGDQQNKHLKTNLPVGRQEGTALKAGTQP
jgi:hypothetical protein